MCQKTCRGFRGPGFWFRIVPLIQKQSVSENLSGFPWPGLLFSNCFKSKVCQKTRRGCRFAFFCFSLGFGAACAADVFLLRVWGDWRRELPPNAGESSCLVAAPPWFRIVPLIQKQSVSENPSGFPWPGLLVSNCM